MSTVGDPTNPRPLRDLPDAVRQRLVEWASQALDAAIPTEIPSTLTRFARFAPAKRAKLAAAALIAAEPPNRPLTRPARSTRLVRIRSVPPPGRSCSGSPSRTTCWPLR